MDSPDMALLNIFFIPPPVVSIDMHGSIQIIDPFSVFICSPRASVHTTAGNCAPIISYFIWTSFVSSAIAHPLSINHFPGPVHCQNGPFRHVHPLDDIVLDAHYCETHLGCLPFPPHPLKAATTRTFAHGVLRSNRSAPSLSWSEAYGKASRSLPATAKHAIALSCRFTPFRTTYER